MKYILLAISLSAYIHASPAPHVDLRFEAGDDVYPVAIHVTFTNNSDQNISVLYPIDGSFRSIFLPYYQLLATNTSGKEYDYLADTVAGCMSTGLGEPKEWPKEMIAFLEPGDSAEFKQAFGAKFDRDLVSIRLRYVTKATDMSTFKIWPLPDPIWMGAVTSDSFVIPDSLKEAEQDAAANP